MANIPSKIQQIIDEGYSFDFGGYISRGFSLVQADLGNFMGYTFIQFLIQMVAGLVPFVGTVAGIVISPPLTVGYSIVAHRIDTHQEYQFNDFFRGFDKLGNLVITALLSALVIMGAALPGIGIMVGSLLTSGAFEGDGDPNIIMIMVSILLILIPVAYFGISYMWAPYFVWFNDLQPWDAMETSRKLVGTNFWTFLGFAIVIGFIGSAGLLLCGIGLLFTVPAMYCAYYACFSDITRLNEDNTSEDDVLSHFVPGE